MSEQEEHSAYVTKLTYTDDARMAIASGIKQVDLALRRTLGPLGSTVCLPPHPHRDVHRITHTGHTVWEDLVLADRFENVGVQILRQAVDGVAETVGDGTTTVSLLAARMVEEGYRLIAAGVNPMTLLKGIEVGTRAAVQEITGLARPVTSYDDLYHVLRTAVADDEVAAALSQAAAKIGSNGLLHVWRGYASEKVKVDYTNGMKYKRGFISPFFLHNQDSDRISLKNAKILIVDGEIRSDRELLPVLQQLKAAGDSSLCVMARQISEDALTLLLVNRERDILNCVATHAPGFGHMQSEMLADIAIGTGGRLVGDQYGLPLSCAKIADLGEAARVIVTKDETSLVGGKYDEAAVRARIQELERVRHTTQDRQQLRTLKERIAHLAGATAVVSIGGSTEAERNELQARALNASHAMHIAEKEGIVPGGGHAYLHAAEALVPLRAELDDETGFGVDIVRKALEAPLCQIAENCGKNGRIVLAQVRRLRAEKNNPYLGYNALTNQYCDLMEAGIIEPLHLSRLVLGYAASCASIILTVDALVVRV